MLQGRFGVSERVACKVLGQPRSTHRYCPIRRDDEDVLTGAIIDLASRYGRYGYRRVVALLQEAGWQVGKDRVQRIWRREGLKVPQKQKPRARLWLNDGSCIRLRPEHPNHVWSYDFVAAGGVRNFVCEPWLKSRGCQHKALFELYRKLRLRGMPRNRRVLPFRGDVA